ncbi:dTMP kinase [Candidatus Saccharibacteria bacterium]|nr:dTMP kinase [Candidatus Saccharibacteria bacterium]
MQTFGKYVVIEGHDGTGKSTQVELVRKKLLEQGIESIEFHEPAGSLVADAIRSVIKNGKLPRDAITNLLLFSAARHDIWFRQALPALMAGKWVIASRNYYSTLAYQGFGEGLDMEMISTVTRIATDDQYLRPDIAIILDLDNETERRKRIASRGSLAHPDTFESKDDEFQSKVNKGYAAIATSHNIPVVSAAQSVDAVQREIWDIIIREL